MPLRSVFEAKDDVEGVLRCLEKGKRLVIRYVLALNQKHNPTYYDDGNSGYVHGHGCDYVRVHGRGVFACALIHRWVLN